jgi:3-dehydro-L-gulonate 2-dehydrogenase
VVGIRDTTFSLEMSDGRRRIPLDEFCATLGRILAEAGLAEERASLVARLFTENQRDGVFSHGLNRFAGFVKGIGSKRVDIDATPEMVESLGVIERWDGKMGIGLWNATECMARAVEIAQRAGMGCVGIRNTNHWMRAGSYALQAADAGCIGICWTNTKPLMPPWGSAEVRIGNNPMAIAIPRSAGQVLLDMAMSQYSFGKLQVSIQQGELLPYPGGYDSEGKLSVDPASVREAQRALPIGYWKGSGLAIVLDIMATVLSGGQSTHEIGRQGSEYGVSQVFIAINANLPAGEKDRDEFVDAIIRNIKAAVPLVEAEGVRYPGERMLRTRTESLEKGVLVDERQWQELLEMV